MMKIFLCQQNYTIGAIAANTEKIIAAIREAKAAGGDLIVFSELTVCGYFPHDLLQYEGFTDRCLAAVELIRREADTIGVLLGAPARNESPTGKKLYNAAYFLYDKEIKQVVHKTLLPTYDIFDEYRYFEPACGWEVISFKGKKLAVTICEDIWNLTENPMYRNCPMDELAKQAPDVMINLSASPFDYVHNEGRQYIVKRNVLHYNLPMIYVTAVGAQTEVVFDGGSMAMDRDGNIVTNLPFFSEGMESVTLNADNSFAEDILKNTDAIPVLKHIPEQYDAQYDIGEIYQALVLGIRDYFGKMGFKKAILGSSGGADSAIVQALASEALGSENVHALLLPSQYSTTHSVSDAQQLCQNLGNPFDILPIKEIFDQTSATLQPVFQDLPFNLTEENIQARIRGILLMAVSNKFGSILLNTSNKSEAAVGYGTLYGDMAGGLSVLGDVYKTQVYAMGSYINRMQEIVPQNILTKAPSAELRPDQKDSDSLPDYSQLDPILYQYIELSQSRDAIVAQGFDSGLVERVLAMVNRNEFKRQQFCPILRVSPKAFGMGRKMPVVAKYEW